MSEILEIVNTMISNKDKISYVTPSRNNAKEFFFLYDNKYRWSINFISNENFYNLFLYAAVDESVENLATIRDLEWKKMDSKRFRYSTLDLRNSEIYLSFKNLYKIVSQKTYGIDYIFYDILKG